MINLQNIRDYADIGDEVKILLHDCSVYSRNYYTGKVFRFRHKGLTILMDNGLKKTLVWKVIHQVIKYSP